MFVLKSRYFPAIGVIILVISANLIAYVPNWGQYMHAGLMLPASVLILLPGWSQGCVERWRFWLPMTLMLGWMFLSVLWSPFPEKWSLNVVWLLLLALTYYLVYVGLRTAGSAAPFLWGVLLSLFIAILIAFIQEGSGLFLMKRYAPMDINENLFSRTILSGVIICCAWLLSRPSLRSAILIWSTLSILLWVQIFLAGSRKGFLLTILVLMFFYLSYPGRISSIKRIAVMGSAILLVYVGVNLVQDTFLWQRTQALSSLINVSEKGEASLTERQEMLWNGLNLFVESPLWGWGLHQYQYISEFRKYSHSNLIEMLVNHGLIGVFLYYNIYYRIWNRYRIRKPSLNRQDLYLFYVFMVTALLWDLAAVSYQTTSLWTVWAFLAFMVYSMPAKAPAVTQAKR